MDIAALSKEITTYLAPFLPYLIEKGGKAIEKAGEKFTSAAWEKAQDIWSKVGKKEEVKSAAKDVMEMPGDEDAQAALRLQVKKLLQEDAGLQQELMTLLKEIKPLVGGDYIEMDIQVSDQGQLKGNITGKISGDWGG